MTTRVDVVVIGAGHNGLVRACYLARAGPAVAALEASKTPGGCIHAVDLPDGRGRFELGAYEDSGIRGSGVAADLELEARFGLRFHLREEVTLAACDDGTALAFHDSLDQTVEGLAAAVGRARPRRIAVLPAGPRPAWRCYARSKPAHRRPCGGLPRRSPTPRSAWRQALGPQAGT